MDVAHVQLQAMLSMRQYLFLLRTALSERLHGDAYRKAMKVGRVVVALLGLILGISLISGFQEKTQAQARLSEPKDVDLDGAISPSDFQFIGQGRVTGGSDNTWLIGNVPFRVNAHTRLGNGLRPGVYVSLSGRILENEVWLADYIELAPKGESFFTFNGRLEAIRADTWLVGGYSLWVDEQTAFGENLEVGKVVLATFTVLKNGQWSASEIKAFSQFPLDPTPIPTPTPTQVLASSQSAFSNAQPGWNANPPKGSEKKDRESKGKNDSKSGGKGKGHGKNKK